MEEGKRKPRIKPADEEEDFDFRNYQLEQEIEDEEESKIEEEEKASAEARFADEQEGITQISQGEHKDAKTQGK